jgi:tRNA threonylcarbamoyladenosine biosynthesis protein TsaB
MSVLAMQPWAARLLAIDASTSAGTVAVLRDGVIVAERTVAMRGEHEERLMPAVAEALGAAGIGPDALTGVVCGAGPGGFTSLRIAASIAKGLAFAAGAPLWRVPSLALIAAGHASAAGQRSLVTLDALRGESYAAVVTVAPDGEVAAYEPLGVVATDALPELARAHAARLLAGEPHVRGVRAAGALVSAAGAVDLDAWEPDYGRKAEAQVKWEAAHGRTLPAHSATPA